VEGNPVSAFRGRYYHTIDEKGRITFPSKLRDLFREKYGRKVVLTNWGEYVLLVPLEVWKDIEEKTASHSLVDLQTREFQRYFISGAVDCSFDAQWRLLVPPELRKHGRLEKDIVLAGMVRTIEIWNRDLFEGNLSQTAMKVDQSSDEIARRLGI